MRLYWVFGSPAGHLRDRSYQLGLVIRTTSHHPYLKFIFKLRGTGLLVLNRHFLGKHRQIKRDIKVFRNPIKLKIKKRIFSVYLSVAYSVCNALVSVGYRRKWLWHPSPSYKSYFNCWANNQVRMYLLLLGSYTRLSSTLIKLNL